MKQAVNKSNLCPACGQTLKPVNTRRCEVCDSVSGVIAEFCSSCGSNLIDPSHGQSPGIQESLRRLLPAQYIEKLLATNGSLKGERRIVTILFADVKGSTSLAESLDPEDVLEIMNGAFEVMIQPILKYEGTLARLMGDAIMALFGAPIAHEDDPERACRAALDIIDGARNYSEHLQNEHGVKGFNMRVGINTGLVVVGEVGAASRVEYTAMGDAVNVAARMETAAEAGNILITDATFKLVNRRFETESVGAISLKGKSEPVSSYRVLRVRESLSGGSGKHQMKTQIIGREVQLMKLREAFDALQSGSGDILAIVGDAGIGKSRLIHEARTRWFHSGIWAECNSFAYTQGKSYDAARTLLHSIVGLQREIETQTVKDALRLTIGRLDQEQASQIIPYLSLLLERTPDQEGEMDFGSIDPQVLNRRLLQAFRTFVRMLTVRQPLVLFADDLHWFDRASLHLLESIFPLAKEVPILIIMAYRSGGEEISNFHKRNSSLPDGSYYVVNVPHLTEEESNLFLDSLPGTAIFASLRHEILTKTEGNPFYIEEVVRQIQERGETTLTVPDTLRGVIMARLDALPVREQQTLQAGSVLGNSFKKHLLDYLMKDVFTPETIDLSLVELNNRGFITCNKQERYVFTNSLTQQVAHESLLLSQRKVLHRRAGEAIESVYTDCLDEYTAELAVHYEIAGENVKALRYLIAAGERASSLYDHAEAIHCYTSALAGTEEVSVGREDLRKIHEGLADAYVICAEYNAALKHYQIAIEHSEGCLQNAVLHRKRGMVLEKSGRYDDALTSFDEAIKNLKPEMNLFESARIYNGLARVYYRRREYSASIDVGMLALDLMKQLGNNWGIAEACGTLGVAHCAAGDLPKGIECNMLALDIWKQEGEIYGLAATLNNLGWLYQQKGDIGLAEERYRESIAICEKNAFRHGLASACDNLSQLLIRQGNRDEANLFLQRAVTILSEIESLEPEPIPELWLQSGTW